MTATKIKPLASGSYTAVNLDAAGRAVSTDAVITAVVTNPGLLLNTLQAVNEWHNAPGNASSSARAQALANAAGASLQDS